jgi:16S rRNA (guanine(966)-N(2))-methyltransferase RsmD
MRVIAGSLRSRQLAAPRGMATRPTSDRLRETLFNILAPRIAGARFADLYAGSGAVGIEAVSRGASHVLFAENAPPALDAVRANLRTLGIASGITLEPRTALAALEATLRARRQLDLVFFDPPWEAGTDYTEVLGLLGGKLGETLLAPGALVIAEHAARTPLPARVGSLIANRTHRQGDAALTFYSRPEPEAPKPPETDPDAANAPPV